MVILSSTGDAATTQSPGSGLSRTSIGKWTAPPCFYVITVRRCRCRVLEVWGMKRNSGSTVPCAADHTSLQPHKQCSVCQLVIHPGGRGCIYPNSLLIQIIPVFVTSEPQGLWAKSSNYSWGICSAGLQGSGSLYFLRGPHLLEKLLQQKIQQNFFPSGQLNPLAWKSRARWVMAQQTLGT